MSEGEDGTSRPYEPVELTTEQLRFIGLWVARMDGAHGLSVGHTDDGVLVTIWDDDRHELGRRTLHES